MRAGFDNGAVVHDHDEVGFLDRGKAMGNADGGAALEEFLEGGLDMLLGLGIE